MPDMPIEEAKSHLRVAIAQIIPSDDSVITEHVKAALAALKRDEFSCRICGNQCDTAPPLPERAVCPEHCEDHEYNYERGEQRHICKHCGQERPVDYFED